MYEVKKSKDKVVFRSRILYDKMPFKTMEVGEYFHLPCNPSQDRARINAAISWKGEVLSKKFSARMVEGGFNIYRTN